MSDDDFDDLDVHDDDQDEGYVRIRKSDLAKVRTAAKSKGAVERELADLKREKAVRSAAPKGLTDRQVAVLAKEAGDDQTPETLARLATELGWTTQTESSEEQQQTDAEIDAQNQAAAATSGAPPPPNRTQVAAEEVNGWPTDRLMRLQHQHPDTYELVLRGQPIDLPAGFN